MCFHACRRRLMSAMYEGGRSTPAIERSKAPSEPPRAGNRVPRNAGMLELKKHASGFKTLSNFHHVLGPGLESAQVTGCIYRRAGGSFQSYSTTFGRGQSLTSRSLPRVQASRATCCVSRHAPLTLGRCEF